MRMEVAREVSVVASPAEGSVASEAIQKPEERLREVAEERQGWFSKRKEWLARKKKLQKLLKLQDDKRSNNELITPHTADNEVEITTIEAQKEDDKAAKAAAVALARKKELKELQARAEAAEEKQQQAVIVLTAQLARTQQSPATKRKRKEDGAEEQRNKKADIGTGEVSEASVTVSEMHPFAAAPDLDVGTAKLAEAACFRIITRYFLTTGTRIPMDMLRQAFKEYTGNTLDEVVDASSLERFIEYVNTDGTKRTTHRSSSETRARRVWWQPGRQFLRTPTFVSSDAEQLQALIDVEKQIVVDVCGILLTSGNQQSRSTALKNMRRQNQFLASLLSDSNAAPNSLTLSNILSACIGVDSSESTTNLTKRIPYRSHGQMAGVFVTMEAWLREQADAIEPQKSVSSRFYGGSDHQKDNYFSTSRYITPFCVENDSVVKQLRGVGALQTSDTKKIDPFKVLCQYELNGVCNDENCSNYHQKDYDPVVNKIINPGAGGTGATRALDPKEKNQLLLLFAEFRGRISAKWPVITTTETSSAAAENDNQMSSAVAGASSADSGLTVVEDMQRSGEVSQEENEDFIMLDPPEELPEIGDSRFIDDIESRKGYGDSLQAKVEEDPNDTDAWILLAIYHLELDVGLSDDAVNFSDDIRLQKQLIFLCKAFSGRHSSSSFRDLNIEEENLKRSLHTLSRALEVEVNAYCEALWLLYLHLCKPAANKQTEIEMVEQAVQFLPSSHALWLRYISTYDFDSVSMAEGIYWRLMEHLARVNSTEDAAQTTPSKDLSILLTAMCFHLCIKLWRAGATRRVLELLSALLQLGDTSSEFEWCGTVRRHLRSDEMIIFCLVLAHVSLFNELPALIEHWVEASSCESIPIKGMAYTVESLPRDSFHAVNNFAPVLASYERAFSIYEKECSGLPDVGGVILSNWMLLLSLQNDDNARDESLKIFFLDKLGTIQQYPTAALTAAKIIGLTSTGNQQARELMLTMINQSSERNFPEALHHYLFAYRLSKDLVNDLDETFPDVMKRLARHLEFDIDAVEKSIQDVLRATSNISKSRALIKLLDSLLVEWMNRLDLQRRGSQQCQSLESQERSSADIYVALAICQLMRILLDASVAIDGLQMVLSSPSFGALSLEARQLAWMQRFVFQMDLLEQNDSDGVSWKERQAKLIQLFRKYMSEMSVKAELLRQVSKRIKHDFERNALEDAVCDCLYPERSCLITYDVSLELFRLCSAAVTGPETASFCASFTNVLALASEFSLTFSDTAVHEWELLAARASLRKCLGGTKTQHSQVLQALVALELRLRNMKSISCLLQNELRADPLILETWRLVMGLEILFGDKVAERSEKIAAEIEKRQLVSGCNTFGDDIVPGDVAPLLSKDSEAATSLNLRGFGLEYVPNAVLLKNGLLSLDLSGNELTELPNGLNRLTNLQKLDASENALVDVPQCLNSMAHLRELRVAHNNLSVAPTLHIPNVSSMDMSWNRVDHLAVADVAALKSMKMLRAEGNAIPADDLSKISDLLSSRKEITPFDVGVVSSQNSSQLTSANVSSEEQSHTSLSGSFSAGGDEDSAVAISAEANTSAATDISSVTAKEGSITTTAMGDAIDRGVNTENITRVAKGDDEVQIMDDEEPTTIAIEENKGEVVDDHNGNSTLASTENQLIDVDAEEVNLTSITIQEHEGEVIHDHNVNATFTSNENHIDVEAEDVKTTSVSKAYNREQNESVVDIEDPAMLIPVEGKNTTQQPKEVIAVDSSESGEEAERDEEELDQTVSDNADVSADTTNKEIMPMTVTDDTESIAEAEDFAQNYSDTITETAGRQRGGPEAVVLSKLTAYMEQNEIGNRAEVRMRNPALWQEFIAANLSGAESMPPCRLCFAPSDGNNQRLNSTALCLHCLEQALDVLKKRRDNLEL